MDIGTVRRILLGATLAVFAVLIGIVALAVSPQGDWVTYDVGSPEYGLDNEGLTVYGTVSCPIEISSNMNFDVDSIDVYVYVVDGDSRELVATVEDESIQAHGTVTVDIDSRFRLSTALLEIYSVASEGQPLHLQLEASCTYLLGLASFTLVSDVYIPIAEEGTGIDIQVTEDTDSSFSGTVGGLEAWILPDEREFTVSGSGMSVDVTIAVSGHSIILTMTSDDVVKTALTTVASSSDLSAVDSEGNQMDISGTTVYALYAVLLFMEWVG